MTEAIDRLYDDPNRAIAQLEKQARPQVASIVSTADGEPVTPKNAFSVQAGRSVIRKGLLTRQPSAKTYQPNTSVTDKDNNYILFTNISNRMSDDVEASNSGIIIGGKMTRQHTATQNVWFRLWLYLSNPGPFKNAPSLMDGNPFNVSWSRRDKRIGYLDFNTFDAGADCSEAPAFVSVGQTLLFQLEENNLYGLLESRSTIQAAESEQMSLYLFITAD